MKNHNLDLVNILLADHDLQVSKIIMGSLREVGFRQIHHARSSDEAVAFLKARPIDILITEWVLHPMDGVSLVNHLRFEKDSPNRGIPIIMLTGKGEKTDVVEARDSGITEFLVKPFTIRALYDRIVYLIDHPRDFVIAQSFVGPDRRRKRGEGGGLPEDRRKSAPKEVRRNIRDIMDLEIRQGPIIIPPDHGIKRLIGIDEPLSTIITPEVLAAAQMFLERSQDENFLSLKGDLENLEHALKDIQINSGDRQAVDVLVSTALAIKSRSGTFGFMVPSRIALTLYRFLTQHYNPHDRVHNEVVARFIESIKVIFAHNPRETHGLPAQLARELEQLVDRVTKNEDGRH